MSVRTIFLQPCRALHSAGSSPHFKLLIAGGGSGGTAIASKFAARLGAGNVGIVEPNEDHYYQPLWTLVGAGLKTLDQSRMKTADVLPKSATWIRERVASIDAPNNTLRTEGGEKITYDYLVTAMGMKLNFEAIKGLPEAWSDPRICSNYSPETVERTFRAFKNFEEGNAIFTFPNTPIKCPGAPQKICYLFEDYATRNNMRDKATILYNTSLPVIFGVKKYAAELLKICEKRDIKLNYRLNLVEVRPDSSEAVFEQLDTQELQTFKYSLLHITPPMMPHAALKESSPELVDASGFVAVDKDSMQSVRFPNVFGIGDCTNAPTSRTAAAVASQSGVIEKNLTSVMAGGKADKRKYDGYTSCPLVTSSKHCILAEFDYNGQPLETLPIDQGKQTWFSYFIKSEILPRMYFSLFLRGMWNGPKVMRKAFHLGMSK